LLAKQILIHIQDEHYEHPDQEGYIYDPATNQYYSTAADSDHDDPDGHLDHADYYHQQHLQHESQQYSHRGAAPSLDLNLQGLDLGLDFSDHTVDSSSQPIPPPQPSSRKPVGPELVPSSRNPPQNGMQDPAYGRPRQRNPQYDNPDHGMMDPRANGGSQQRGPGGYVNRMQQQQYHGPPPGVDYNSGRSIPPNTSRGNGYRQPGPGPGPLITPGPSSGPPQSTGHERGFSGGYHGGYAGYTSNPQAIVGKEPSKANGKHSGPNVLRRKESGSSNSFSRPSSARSAQSTAGPLPEQPAKQPASVYNRPERPW
jgi:hypothetical protein